MPSRRDGAHCLTAKQGDKRLGQNLESYHRMAKAGLNPKSLENAAQIERTCESAVEVAMGTSAVDLAKRTGSYRSGDVGAARDVSRGAPEFRRRLEEGAKAMERGEKISK
jgi:hypothetical protein